MVVTGPSVPSYKLVIRDQNEEVFMKRLFNIGLHFSFGSCTLCTLLQVGHQGAKYGEVLVKGMFIIHRVSFQVVVTAPSVPEAFA